MRKDEESCTNNFYDYDYIESSFNNFLNFELILNTGILFHFGTVKITKCFIQVPKSFTFEELTAEPYFP